jgi:hypothetical protein
MQHVKGYEMPTNALQDAIRGIKRTPRNVPTLNSKRIKSPCQLPWWGFLLTTINKTVECDYCLASPTKKDHKALQLITVNYRAFFRIKYNEL